MAGGPGRVQSGPLRFIIALSVLTGKFNKLAWDEVRHSCWEALFGNKLQIQKKL